MISGVSGGTGDFPGCESESSTHYYPSGRHLTTAAVTEETPNCY